MTYTELAKKILIESDEPLTVKEIWTIACEKGLDKQLNKIGKTPCATLGAMIHGNFPSTGGRPNRFYLKNKDHYLESKEYEKEKNSKEHINFLEKDLHSFLTYFAHKKMGCYTKTIEHLKSNKKGYGEWVHPDMVGGCFNISKWQNEVLELSSATGNSSVKFISFELKKELTLSNLRESFFQTVSNSSWANESYLVASKISKYSDFLSELSRLSSSFGIGIIQLNLEDPDAGVILFRAETKDLDWDTINKLAEMNSDFKEFVKRVNTDVRSNEIRKEQYDKILKKDELIKLVSQ